MCCFQDDDRERPEPELVYRVAPGERMPYAWDFPAVERKKIYISCNKRSRKIDMMEIGALPPLKVSLLVIMASQRAHIM